jgi:hypothetical protein
MNQDGLIKAAEESKYKRSEDISIENYHSFLG